MRKFNPIRYFFVLLLLVACQVVDAGSDAITVSVTLSPTLSSVTVEATATITPTPVISDVHPTPTVEVTPSSTEEPFLCPNLYGLTESKAFSSEAIQEEVRYLVHLPPCYDIYETAALPVLYLFHGWPLDEQHWLSVGVDTLVDDWVTRGLIGPVIIVLPGVSRDGLYVNSSGGARSFEGMIVDELVPLVDQAYRTWRDPRGRAVGGISRGGVWALEIAMRHSDVFSIVGAHSPALALNHPVLKYDPFVLAKGDVSGLRFYLDAGDRDWARASTIRLRDVLQAAEVDVTYQVHSGGHVDDLWQGALADYVMYYTLNWPASFGELPAYVNE